MAETLGETEHVSLLEETLEEEKETDEKLTELAQADQLQKRMRREHGRQPKAEQKKTGRNPRPSGLPIRKMICRKDLRVAVKRVPDLAYLPTAGIHGGFFVAQRYISRKKPLHNGGV